MMSHMIFTLLTRTTPLQTYNLRLADRSKTEWFWVVDREYDFNGKLLFIPQEHELDYIHVFKVPDMLEERYPLDIEEPWDNRCGGVRLVNKNFDMTWHKYVVLNC